MKQVLVHLSLYLFFYHPILWSPDTVLCRPVREDRSIYRWSNLYKIPLWCNTLSIDVGSVYQLGMYISPFPSAQQ